MKRITNIILATTIAMSVYVACAAPSFSAVIPRKSYSANVQTKRLAKGTTLRLEIMDPISTAESAAGDMFQAMLVEDKITDGAMILPKGTVFRGTVDRVEPSKRVSYGAVLYISIDHVVTPVGRQVPIQTGLMSNGVVLTTDGGIKAGGNYGYAVQKNWEKSTEIIEDSIDWGVNAGDKVGNWVKYITIPVGAVCGTVGGVGYFIGDSVADLFKKGGDVTFHQGSTINFVLTESVDVPVN